MPTIQELPTVLDGLSDATRADVDRVLRIEVQEGLGDVPLPLRAKAARWCGSTDASSEAWRALERQCAVSIHNRWTFETSNFNALRASRPVVAMPSGNGEDSVDAVAESCEGPGRCDFCELERLTCVEPFGRVKGTHATTAGNAFKSSGLHGLVIWDRHAPHKLTTEEISDGFKVADTWFERATAWDAREGSGRARFPIMFWNRFPAGGASQIHPHMQLQLFGGPVGREALFLEQDKRYQQQHPGRTLCTDLVLAHQHLGLVVSECIWASLTPHVGGGELCALSPSAATDDDGGLRLAPLGPTVAAMIAALERCGAEAISTVAFRVPMGNGRMSWLVNCLNRGRARAQVVDAGSAEMMGVTGVGSDPYKLAAALRDVLKLAEHRSLQPAKEN